MSVRPSEYGARGLLGIGVPQANPTVEHEFGLMRPPGVGLVAARLFSRSPDPRKRLEDYLSDLAMTLERFDDLSLDVFGFACTGSTYLQDAGHEAAFLGRLQERFGYPILTAAAAIETVLRELGARRILIVAPYPPWLGILSAAYWREAGFEVADLALVALPSADTHTIYALTSEHATAALQAANPEKADAVLISGTGMPSLHAIQAATARGLTVISSNLCLLWAMLRAAGYPVESPSPGRLLVSGWEEQLHADRRGAG